MPALRKGSRRGRGLRRDGRSERQGEGFVRLAHRFLDSPAVAAMSPEAFKLLVCGPWRRHNGANNGEIAFSVSEAQALLRCGRRQAGEALAELEARGFLRCTQPAAMLGQRSRRWAITEEAEAAQGGSTAPTLAARRSSAEQQAEITDGLKRARHETESGPPRKNPRIPVRTAPVSPSEPQIVPKRDDQPLRIPVGTANDHSPVGFRIPVRTSSKLSHAGCADSAAASATAVGTQSPRPADAGDANAAPKSGEELTP